MSFGRVRKKWSTKKVSGAMIFNYIASIINKKGASGYFFSMVKTSCHRLQTLFPVPRKVGHQTVKYNRRFPRED